MLISERELSVKAFKEMVNTLRQLPNFNDFKGKYLLFHNGEYVETFISFSEGIKFGNRKFGFDNFVIKVIK